MVTTAWFVVGKLLGGLAAPSTLLLLCSVAGFVALVAASRTGRVPARLGLALLALPVAFALVLAVIPFDDWIAAPLEDRFPRLAAVPPDAVGAIALGGAVDPEMSAARGMPSLNDAAERMTAFVALARVHPGLRLAFTGGSGRVLRSRLSEADVARALFDQLGLAGRPVVYESASRTTWENATDLARLVHPRPGERWVLITSALHMPRAIGAFRAAGWTVVADPVGYKTAPVLSVETAPGLPGRLGLIDGAAHEWLGLLAYRLTGRTPRLLPRP